MFENFSTKNENPYTGKLDQNFVIFGKFLNCIISPVNYFSHVGDTKISPQKINFYLDIFGAEF